MADGDGHGRVILLSLEETIDALRSDRMRRRAGHSHSCPDLCYERAVACDCCGHVDEEVDFVYACRCAVCWRCLDNVCPLCRAKCVNWRRMKQLLPPPRYRFLAASSMPADGVRDRRHWAHRSTPR